MYRTRRHDKSSSFLTEKTLLLNSGCLTLHSCQSC